MMIANLRPDEKILVLQRNPNKKMMPSADSQYLQKSYQSKDLVIPIKGKTYNSQGVAYFKSDSISIASLDENFLKNIKRAFSKEYQSVRYNKKNNEITLRTNDADQLWEKITNLNLNKTYKN